MSQEVSIAIMSAMLTPAAMITACGLLLLGVYNKYTSVVASIRKLNAEMRRIDSDGAVRADQIRQESALLRSRLDLLLRQFAAICCSTVLFLGGAVMIGVGMVVHANLGPAALATVILGEVVLAVAMISSVQEVRFIRVTIDAEIKPLGD